MMVTDITYERIDNDDTVWKVHTISSHDYQPDITENETARLASRTVDHASAPAHEAAPLNA
jgi:hypothetical protein